ncbi:MAG: xanthine dehydrogenase family protein molybdopterin-binding subunit [Pyrinomonadaceae bacterium]|nr:xanthine dehydrogenase family protein molybdopterin-binding subunit [Pyrinomonadaceae bacterium]
MSITQKIMETVAQFMPDKEPDPLLHKHGFIGKPFSRVDGRLKVMGEATFTAEFKIENIAYAALVYSTIAKGKITKIERSEAEKSAGVLAVITHENVPKMNDPATYDPAGDSSGSANSDLPILRDEKIYWNGQPVAVVVAETQDQTEQAAKLINVEYETEDYDVSFDALKDTAVPPKEVMSEPPEVKIGDAEDALEKAEFKIDNIYRTPRYNHNAIEPHATIAVWGDDDETLTIFEPSQTIYAVKNTFVKMFDLAPERVRVISPFVGGGFGGKGGMWWYTALCVAAAKAVNRPVKLALSREGVFRVVGGRTPSEQRVALGANKDGKLSALIQSGVTATTTHNNFAEHFSFPARHLYASENFFIGQKVVFLDTVANTFMRGPGESIGGFALESAMDEFAFELKIDPIELRRINEPAKDPTKDTEFSMRNLIEAYKRGAEKFDWVNNPPRSQKDGKWLIGQGVATAYYPFYRFTATARVRINADGTAIVQTAAHEMGMGTATVQIQHAAERLGLPIDRVAFEYGDSDLPESSMAGGSSQTVSIGASVRAAIEKAHRELLALAGDDYDSPFSYLKYDQIEARNGGLFSKKDASEGETYASILKRVGQDYVEAEETSAKPYEIMKYSMGSYGAQFCEVRVNEESGEVRVSRFLGSFDCGRILNPKTATSQFRGGIIMGIGMALTEETLFDERRGRIMNPSLAEYHVPVNLDIPKIEIIYNDIPDEHAPLGAHGIGEIGITGVAAAIANAVFNATGKRVRDLPITPDKLL